MIPLWLDNARYPHAVFVPPWMAQPCGRIRLHFICAYRPHLNPIERLGGLMPEAVSGSLREKLPKRLLAFPREPGLAEEATPHFAKCRTAEPNGAFAKTFALV